MIRGEGFTVNESKFDFFFGRVTSSPRNAIRSRDNLEGLRKLGIEEESGGRERLLEVFEDGLNAAQIGSERVGQYGVTLVKRVEVNDGEVPGAIEVSYLYRNGDMNSIPEVTTIIPKTYR